MDISHLSVETGDFFASLLELAANNDVEGVRRSIGQDPSCVDETGLWYGRRKGFKQMVNEQRTPLMVAATYGSIDVLRLILSSPEVDVNRTCGIDNSTALHCAASSGSVHAVDAVKLLLAAGADPNVVDANGDRPIDVVVVPPKFPGVKLILEELLASDGPVAERHLRISTAKATAISPPFSPSVGKGTFSSAAFSPMKSKTNDALVSSVSEKKEYPVDPSLPDINNGYYSTDEFRMYIFKVRPCSRAYSHDWTECPFVHPGENARRRDPTKFHYGCVPCPDFRKGACRRGDMCEYAHGVFESWLHPAQYRTRLCKDGTSCERRVCFFAHTAEELRPLYVSTGSAVSSPCSSSGANGMDFAAAMSVLPGSPSSVMSPTPFAPSMSLSANGMSHSSGAWPQPNVPPIHLPGSNLNSSRLRSLLNARDIPAEDYNFLPDFDPRQPLVNELSNLAQPSLSNKSLSNSGRLKMLSPSNLDDLFAAENSSPLYSDQALASNVFSPTHKSAAFNQFQQHQSLLSPINTSFSPKSVDHSLLQASFSPSRMSPCNVEPLSPLKSRVSMLADCDKHRQQLRSLSSRELGASFTAVIGSPIASPSRWGSSNNRPDWMTSTEESTKLRRSNSFDLTNVDEPDISWVQSLVKEPPADIKERLATPVNASSSESSNTKSNIKSIDHAIGVWMEQLQIDQLVAQQN